MIVTTTKDVVGHRLAACALWTRRSSPSSGNPSSFLVGAPWQFGAVESRTDSNGLRRRGESAMARPTSATPPATNASTPCWRKSSFAWRSRSPKWAGRGSTFRGLGIGFSPSVSGISGCHYSVLVHHPTYPYKLAPRAGRLVRVGWGRE
jgi:hypothetical protein